MTRPTTEVPLAVDSAKRPLGGWTRLWIVVSAVWVAFFTLASLPRFPFEATGPTSHAEQIGGWIGGWAIGAALFPGILFATGYAVAWVYGGFFRGKR